ncbi:protein CFT1 [Purpureocillium lavendulum]|uniref:Protein CFT1 n=1 Tax=Purpureocillium lavendulum TaxID=1247861 RepID=A0AB34FW54_9HYPO|nr:protein CFT1 [Purpureocillium lavendulum]
MGAALGSWRHYVYTELAAPSAVTHSLSLPLTSASASNLVVAKGSLLQIFATRAISAELDPHSQKEDAPTVDAHFDRRANDDDGLEASFLGGETMLVRADRSTNTKLVLVAEMPLAGTVIGMARIRVKTASGGDALLLAYRAAKMCLTEWDPQRSTLETTSIHYYEKDELQGAPWEVSVGEYVNYLEADPGSRCAAFKFGTRNLAILPFAQSEEDLEMDDWDEDLDGPRPAKGPTANGDGNGDGGDGDKAAYTPSFVLRLPLLDPTLLHPVHLAFLHEYREPTFGILSSSQAPSPALGVKDNLSYKVFTLDLKQRASTAILSVTGLPRDLFKVVALPAPMGGALLVGENELVHIDQSGKPNGVAVNDMAKQTTAFSLADQCDLGLRLEGCAVEQLAPDNGELLLVLNDGRLAVVSFKIDGRTVSGINVRPVAPENGGHLVRSGASCTARLGKSSSFFIGSETGDSVVLGWSRKQTQEKHKRRALDPDLGLDVDELDLDDDEDDDLYGNNDDAFEAKPSLAVNGGAAKPGDVVFRIQDSLLSIAPILDVATGSPQFLADSEEASLAKGVSAELQLACAVGRGKAGAIAILNREIQPRVIGRFEFPEARGFWTMCVKKPMSKALGAGASVAEGYDPPAQYDKYMIVAKVDLDGYETSDVYAVTGAGFETLRETEFEPAAGFTVEAGTMGKQMRIIQVLKSEVRCYDGDLGLAQILPMLDEETGAEPRALSASIVDPYLLLVRDDGSVFLAQMDSSNELEEVEKTGGLQSKWVSGCLYRDATGAFQLGKAAETILMFLLNASGSLHIYALPDLSKPVFVAECLTSIPPFLSADFVARRGASKESVAEILVADLGDAVAKTPYLIVRHANDDLTLYEPIKHQPDGGGDASLLLKKTTNAAMAKAPEETPTPQDETTELPRFFPLRPCANVGGYSAVFMPGPSPSFLLKSSKSIPRVVGLQGLGSRGMSTFHTEGCDHGFIYADAEGVARVTQLPDATNFTELGLSVRKMALDQDIRSVSYHQPTGTYVAACTTYEPFELPRDDDYHKEWARETISFPPTVARGVLKLINPATWTVIHSLELEPCESIESMRTLHLEVSEETRERRMLVAVGTALSKGEDLPTRGRVQVFDIVAVIPEPGRPETNRRLKLIAKEEIPRGGVTALSEIGTQGLMLVAQGQKCMVRGLKEDGSLLPVAFLDMNCHVASAKGLPGTGLCLMADAFKGLWFAGYTEEPYTFKVLGKSSGNLPLLVADFLPDGEDLSLVAVDADGDMHILEFNPEHPKSLQGHLLLHRASFSVTPNPPTSSMLLPRTSRQQHHQQQQQQPHAKAQHVLFLASPSGQLSALTPLPESTYRRLLSVTNQLHPALVPHAGLHAKAYRVPDTQGRNAAIGVETAASWGRSVVDGAVLARWTELGAAKRSEIASRGGYDSAADLRADLDAAAEAALDALAKLLARGVAAAQVVAARGRRALAVRVADAAHAAPVGARVHLKGVGLAEVLAVLAGLEVALDGEGGLALAFVVLGMVLLGGGGVEGRERGRKTYHARPALVGAAVGVGLAHEVGALLVVHDAAAQVAGAGGDGRGALEGHVALKAVLDVLAGGGAQGGLVGGLDGGDGAVLLVEVAAREGGVVGPAVVVGAADGVEGVDGVRLGDALAVALVRAAVGGAGVGAQHVERAVRHVAGEALVEGAVTLEAGGGGVESRDAALAAVVVVVVKVARMRRAAAVLLVKGWSAALPLPLPLPLPALPRAPPPPRVGLAVSDDGGVGYPDEWSSSADGALGALALALVEEEKESPSSSRDSCLRSRAAEKKDARYWLTCEVPGPVSWLGSGAVSGSRMYRCACAVVSHSVLGQCERHQPMHLRSINKFVGQHNNQPNQHSSSSSSSSSSAAAAAVFRSAAQPRRPKRKLCPPPSLPAVEA